MAKRMKLWHVWAIKLRNEGVFVQDIANMFGKTIFQPDLNCYLNLAKR